MRQKTCLRDICGQRGPAQSDVGLHWLLIESLDTADITKSVIIFVGTSKNVPSDMCAQLRCLTLTVRICPEKTVLLARFISNVLTGPEILDRSTTILTGETTFVNSSLLFRTASQPPHPPPPPTHSAPPFPSEFCYHGASSFSFKSCPIRPNKKNMCVFRVTLPYLLLLVKPNIFFCFIWIKYLC